MVLRESNKFPAVTLMYMLCLLPCINLTGIKLLAGDLYQVWLVAAAAIMTYRLYHRMRFTKLNSFAILFIMYELIIYFSTVYCYGVSMGIAVMIYIMVLLVLLLQSDLKYILQALAILGVMVACINLLGMIVVGPDEEQRFFIGGKNQLSMILVPCAFVKMIDSLNRVGKIKKADYVFAVLCIVSVFIGQSSTGVVVAAATIVALLVLKNTKNSKALLLGGLVFINILLVFGTRVLFESRYWLWITELLGKSATLTMRTTIWGLVLEALEGRALFGLGRGIEIIFRNSYGGWTIVYEAHNFLLEIFLEGGICAFICYAAAFIQAVGGLNLKDLRHKLVFLMIFVMLINGFTESTNNSLFVIIAVAMASVYSNQEKKKEYYDRR